jgi:hypothetical protein
MFASVELFEIDAAGRVRDYQGTRLSRWQVTGRDFARELAWSVGAEAARRIADFRARGLDLDRFAARVITRAGADDVEVTLRRLRDGATALSLQYARDRVSPPSTVSAGSGSGRSSSSGTSARLSGGGSARSPGQPRTPTK